MQTHQKTKKIKNKKSIFEISNYKKASDLSTDNLQFSNFSTKLTNTTINNARPSGATRGRTLPTF